MVVTETETDRPTRRVSLESGALGDDGNFNGKNCNDL